LHTLSYFISLVWYIFYLFFFIIFLSLTLLWFFSATYLLHYLNLSVLVHFLSFFSISCFYCFISSFYRFVILFLYFVLYYFVIFKNTSFCGPMVACWFQMQEILGSIHTDDNFLAPLSKYFKVTAAIVASWKSHLKLYFNIFKEAWCSSR